ncbi:hypothetical protein AB4Y90_12790 [Chryseobacterium sp. 2TAF14]|uniref:hypothetical protein n=1 Tax=Chryseobacterium sp. 2TAF14 TaxID=3233007 RepID=UPI003F8FCB3B
MKKFIPIFSMALAALCTQNCTHRDEDTITDKSPKEEMKNNLLMKSDSAKSPEQIIDPDPPVRDGDNWRHHNNN